jgi:hypothetical protein
VQYNVENFEIVWDNVPMEETRPANAAVLQLACCWVQRSIVALGMLFRYIACGWNNSTSKIDEMSEVGIGEEEEV